MKGVEKNQIKNGKVIIIEKHFRKWEKHCCLFVCAHTVERTKARVRRGKAAAVGDSNERCGKSKTILDLNWNVNK